MNGAIEVKKPVLEELIWLITEVLLRKRKIGSNKPVGAGVIPCMN
jgi:hypothetical protein